VGLLISVPPVEISPPAPIQLSRPRPVGLSSSASPVQFTGPSSSP